MKVFITGHLGYVGGHVLEKLIEEEIEYVGFDLKEGKDVTNYEQVEKEMEGCDAVIHIAGVTARSGDMRFFMNVNVEGTLNILEAARVNKVKRVIYMSSTGYYGLDIDGEIKPKYFPIDEDHPIASQGTGFGKFEDYNTSKVMAEQLCAYYGTNFMEVIVLRSGPCNSVEKQYREGFDPKTCTGYQKKAFWTRNDPLNIGVAFYETLVTEKEFTYRVYNICNKYIDDVVFKKKTPAKISSERFRKEICDLPL